MDTFLKLEGLNSTKYREGKMIRRCLIIRIKFMIAVVGQIKYLNIYLI